MISRNQLISAPYLDLQKQLHAAPRGYGQKGSKWAPSVCLVVSAFTASSVLDYGCGACSLARTLRDLYALPVRIAEYDPAIAGKDALPSFADVVVSTDVLEHIEPDRLDVVLQHIRSLARKAVFLVVSTRVASKTLADGRNAHLIVQPAEWWQARVEAVGFTVHPAPLRTVKPDHKPSREWVAVLTP